MSTQTAMSAYQEACDAEKAAIEDEATARAALDLARSVTLAARERREEAEKALLKAVAPTRWEQNGKAN